MKTLLLTLLLLLTFTVAVLSQGTLPPPMPDKPQQTPLTGIEWLALGGIGYGIKKIRDKSKQ